MRPASQGAELASLLVGADLYANLYANPLHERVCEALYVAEGVGFEPTVGFNTYSGLANRRTRPAMRPFRKQIN